MDYAAPVLTIFPKDTTVFRKAPFNLYYNVTGLSPVSVLWSNSDAYTLSCNTCSSPVASMLDSGMVNLQYRNNLPTIIQQSCRAGKYVCTPVPLIRNHID
jgi:hypothetical protein